jgi:peptide/nickel transport system permease protein
MKIFHLPIIRKLGYSALSLFLLISLVFILLRMSPGDPALKFVSPELSPKLAEKARDTFMLDRPVYEQYFSFLKNLISGDLGVSYSYRQPVTQVLSEAVPFTAVFSIVSFLFQVIVSAALIFFISKRMGGKIDKFLHNFSLAVYSIPTIIIAAVLISVFAVKLNILPSSDYHSFNYDEFSFFGKLADIAAHMILPLFTLSLGGILIFYNYLRENINSVYEAGFIKYLRANCYSEKEIFRRHILPNSVSPLIAVMGVELGILLGGALITETIFGLPGMGRLTVNAILARDYPLVTGCVLVSGVFVIMANLLAEVIRMKIDPRLK